MEMDLNAKAKQLLEKIANSVHERGSENPILFCFSAAEVQLVEKWLTEFVDQNLN